MLYKDTFEDTNRKLIPVAKQRWEGSSSICTSWLTRTIDDAPNREAGIIIGVGAANDFDLEAVVKRFEKVYLVDIDRISIQSAIQTLPDELQGRVIPVVEDITSIGQHVSDVIIYLQGEDVKYEDAISRVKSLNRRLSDSFKLRTLDACSWVFSDCISTQLLGPLFIGISDYYSRNQDNGDTRLYGAYIELNLSLFGHYVKFLSKLLVQRGVLAFASDVIHINDEFVTQLENTARKKIADIATDPGMITRLTNVFPNRTIAGWYIDSVLERDPKIRLNVMPTNKKSWLWDFNDDKKYLVIGKQLNKY